MVSGCIQDNLEMYIPAFNEVFEVVGPANAVVRLVFQFGNWLADDVGKEIYKPCAGLHFCPVGREWESVLRNFQQSHSKRPDVGRDGV